MESASAQNVTKCVPPRLWLSFLCAVCAVAEGATLRRVRAASRSTDGEKPAAAAACISAVLFDGAQRRVAVFGGRAGMPRSLGSVYGSAVTRFLGGSRFQGVVSRIIALPDTFEPRGAVSRDGSTLLVSDDSGCIHVLNAADGEQLRTINSVPRWVGDPWQVWVAADGFVFVADHMNQCVVVLTPQYDFHANVGIGHLRYPAGVCADDDFIAVTEHVHNCIAVFNRNDGAFRYRFPWIGLRLQPGGLCIISTHRQLAVADSKNGRVSVVGVDGLFVRHIGVGKLFLPMGVAWSSATNELVVAAVDRMWVFSACGEVVWSSKSAFQGVAVHGKTIFAFERYVSRCVVFT